MDIAELVNHIVHVLNQRNLAYFVTGSYGTIYYGEARFTNDVDVVVDLDHRTVEDFCAAFPPAEFYLDLDRARHAVARRTQFNIIHPSSGLKIDVLVPRNDAFDRERFRRVRRIRLPSGDEAAFASPEDLILKKLEYFRACGSEKHLRDISGLFKVLGREHLDLVYLEHWVVERGLEVEWRRVLERMASA
jgi:hypothetical protein